MRHNLAFLLLFACTPSPSELPITVTPTPTASPTPVPVFIVPPLAPANSPVTVSLCEPYAAGTELWADVKYKLGTFGENKASGCMQLIVFFNTPGVRTLTSGLHTAKIEVTDETK
jgi:hypothetical protein